MSIAYSVPLDVKNRPETPAGASHERPVVRAERITLGYPRRVIAQDLSFEIHAGDIVGIVGPNGCGKTTLLRTILNLMKPLEGRVHRDRELVVSYVPQRDRLDTLLPITVLEVVTMGLAARTGPMRALRQDGRDRARRALAQVETQSLAQHLFRNLSGGQQQRVLLARALAADPDVLVLDEPTAGMDIASEAAVLGLLGALNRSRGVTILLVTHMLSLVLNFARSIMLMGGGRILHGTVDDVLNEDRLSALYGVPIRLDRVGRHRMLTVTGGDACDV